MYLPRLPLFLVIFAASLHAADQKGAETVKKPISADIVSAIAAPHGIGNVRVTYSDRSQDIWTTRRNCSLPRVSSTGVVGWTLNSPEVKPVTVSYTVRRNPILILCRAGKVIERITSGKGFIEEWDFIKGQPRLVLLTRSLHGPADVELYDTETGALIERLSALDPNLPDWAKPYSEH